MYKELLCLLVFVSSLLAQNYGGINRQRGRCIVPPHPDHGIYHIVNVPDARPGESYNNLQVRVICSGNFRVEGSQIVNCLSGRWYNSLQNCVLSSNSAEGVGRVNPSSSVGKCILPPYPEHGSYISSIPNAKPGDVYTNVNINIFCAEEYELEGPDNIYCLKGWWKHNMSECVSTSGAGMLDVRYDNLESTEKKCIFPSPLRYGSYDTDIVGGKTGDVYEKFRIIAKCTEGFTLIGSTTITCNEGNWSAAMPNCVECGTLPAKGKQLILNGNIAKLGDMPWHVAIYRLQKGAHELICGGSLISNNCVISAAHCFWDPLQGQLPASDYTVKVGNVFRDFDSKLEKSQRSKVKTIRIPKRFRGADTNFQDDIAVMELITTITFSDHIQPVCIDFQTELDDRQLQEGINGTVAGWGLTTEDGSPAQELRVVELPYVPIEKCYEDSPLQFKPLLTSDKICAGYENAGTALCQGDSGGGLAIPKRYGGTTRYFLRGIASTSPTVDNRQCNADSYTAFTWIIKHGAFISKAKLGQDSPY